MRGRALIVPRSEGERVRRVLLEVGLLRPDLSIRVDGETIVLPVAADGVVPPGLGRESEEEFEPIAAKGPADYRDLVAGPDDARALLPRSFDVVGDVVLVRIPDELAGRSTEIGRALLEFVPGARLVGVDRGVHGTARRRSLGRLAGEGSWRTRHRENGIELEVDPERAYFSPRLAREHARVAADVEHGDRVYDLCCGVGPFAATIARDGRARSVVAIDSNPDAIELLAATLRRLPNGERVTARVADVAEFVASAPPAERVILNLPHEGIKYLPSVARTVAPRGRLYYYEVTPRTELERRGETIVRSFHQPAEWRTRESHLVHPYSPVADLIGYVFERDDGPEVVS
jgi:tRNA (guanine37-N1)-methyltransferase